MGPPRARDGHGSLNLRRGDRFSASASDPCQAGSGVGIVKILEDRHGDTYPDLPWEPKAAFAAIADHFRD